MASPYLHQPTTISLVLSRKLEIWRKPSQNVHADLANIRSDNEAPQFKLDIRDEPIQEEGDAQSALSSVASTLRAVNIAETIFLPIADDE